MLRFDGYEADVAAGELRKNGARVPLELQPFEVLAMMLERPGEVVTREEIQAAVWPDVHIDIDTALNTAIRKIRRALGDSASHPKYLETLPKRGYRFVGEAAGPADEVKQRSRGGRWAVAVLMATVAAGVVYLAGRDEGAPPRKSEAPTPVRLTSLPGVERYPSFSPDGSQVVFAWNGGEGEEFDLYVQEISSGIPRRLTYGEGDEVTPVWSPDGQWIAFWKSHWQDGGIYLIRPSGGGEKMLLGGLPSERMEWRHPLSWSFDSRWIAFTDSRDGRRRISAVSVTGEKVALTDPPADAQDSAPAFSPDGRRLAWKRFLGLGNSRLYTRALPDGKELRVNGGPRPGYWIGWTPDSGSLILGGNHYVPVLSVVDIETGELREIPHTSPATEFAVSTTGNIIAFARTERDTDILRIDLPSGDSSPVLQSTLGERAAQISPDGSKISLTSFRTGSNAVWIVNADGSAPVPLVDRGHASRWSPDGTKLAFDRSLSSEDGSGYGIWVIGAEGGAPQLVFGKDNQADQPCWSTDGSRLFFNRRPGGASTIWGIDVDSESAPYRISKGQGRRCWAAGQWVYFGRDEDIWRARQDGEGDDELVLAGRLFHGSAHWQVRDSSLYFIDFQEGLTLGRWALKKLDLSNGKESELIELPRPPGRGNGLSVASDESFILYTVENMSQTDLMLIKGFE